MRNFLLYFIFIPFAVLFIGIYAGAHTSGRALTESELYVAKGVYGEEINLDSVRIVYGSVFSYFAPVTLGSTIHINSSQVQLNNEQDLSQTPYARFVLIHEIEHVFQYRTIGWMYLVQSMQEQFYSLITTGSRDNAYTWHDKLTNEVPFEEWGIEEQAEAIASFSYYTETGNEIRSTTNNSTKELGCYIPSLRTRFCQK
jgi:hypothetical protein